MSEELQDLKEYIKGFYLYPNGNIKLCFRNNKQRIFINEKQAVDYINEHKKELL